MVVLKAPTRGFQCPQALEGGGLLGSTHGHSVEAGSGVGHVTATYIPLEKNVDISPKCKGGWDVYSRRRKVFSVKQLLCEKIVGRNLWESTDMHKKKENDCVLKKPS